MLAFSLLLLTFPYCKCCLLPGHHGCYVVVVFLFIEPSLLSIFVIAHDEDNAHHHEYKCPHHYHFQLHDHSFHNCCFRIVVQWPVLDITAYYVYIL